MTERRRVYDTGWRGSGRGGHEGREKETSEVKVTYDNISQSGRINSADGGGERSDMQGGRGTQELTENIGSKLKVVAVRGQLVDRWLHHSPGVTHTPY